MLAQRLKQLLLALNITEGEFAKCIGYSPAYISMLICEKKSNPSARFYEAASREFCVNPQWLKDGEGEMFDADRSRYSSFDRSLLMKYWKLPAAQRRAVNEIIDAMLNKQI